MKAIELERDKFKKSVDARAVLAIDIGADLDAETERSERLETRVKNLETNEVALLESKATTFVECENNVNTCLYLFWKFNRDVNLSFLPPAVLVKEKEGFLQCLTEEEKEAAEKVARPPPDAPAEDYLTP